MIESKKWCLALMLVGVPGCFAPAPDDEVERNNSAIESTTQAAVRGMMGLSPTPSSDPSPDVARFEAVGRHMLEVLQQQDPGALSQFDRDLLAHDANRSAVAWKSMRARLANIAESPELEAAVANDPLLAGTSGGDNNDSNNDSNGKQASSGDSTDDGSGDLKPAGGGDDSGSDNGKGGTSTKSFDFDFGLGIRTTSSSGVPDLGRGRDGRYGDNRTGRLGALADLPDLAVGIPVVTLVAIDRGEAHPDPESRLGAYAATRGYPAGTVGDAVHHAIGTIYTTFGNYGQEKIGRVFNAPEARALYRQPVASPAGRLMAQIEYNYWANVLREDPSSPGGNLGSAFSPAARDWLQRRVFSH